MQDISQDLSNTDKATELRELSEVFEAKHPPKKRIQILVECPAGELIKTTVCGAEEGLSPTPRQSNSTLLLTTTPSNHSLIIQH